MGRLYEALKAIPTAVYQTLACAAVLATATHLATKPSEQQKKQAPLEERISDREKNNAIIANGPIADSLLGRTLKTDEEVVAYVTHCYNSGDFKQVVTTPGENSKYREFNWCTANHPDFIPASQTDNQKRFEFYVAKHRIVQIGDKQRNKLIKIAEDGSLTSKYWSLEYEYGYVRNKK